jgi:hypothetical protein
MWIVAIGWMYVVTLMAATEPTVVGGIMTFFGYGVLPFSLVFYLAGSRRRRARAARAAVRAADGRDDAAGSADGGCPPSTSAR